MAASSEPKSNWSPARKICSVRRGAAWNCGKELLAQMTKMNYYTIKTSTTNTANSTKSRRSSHVFTPANLRPEPNARCRIHYLSPWHGRIGPRMLLEPTAPTPHQTHINGCGAAWKWSRFCSEIMLARITKKEIYHAIKIAPIASRPRHEITRWRVCLRRWWIIIQRSRKRSIPNPPPATLPWKYLHCEAGMLKTPAIQDGPARLRYAAKSHDQQ